MDPVLESLNVTTVVPSPFPVSFTYLFPEEIPVSDISKIEGFSITKVIPDTSSVISPSSINNNVH